MSTSPATDAPPRLTLRSQFQQTLQRPLTPLISVSGWLLATLVYFYGTWVTGGPSQGDLSVSEYSTWLIAHGDLGCAFFPIHSQAVPIYFWSYTHIAPLYPLISGALIALINVPGKYAFPHPSAFGPHCANVVQPIYHWALSRNLIDDSINIGYLMWPVLLCGLICLLRTTRAGRTGWEPLVLLSVAVAPPIWESLTEYFHPQDFLAFGLLFLGMAAARTNRPGWAGAAFAFGMLSNQFVLLGLILILVLQSNRDRLRLIIVMALTWLAVALPLDLITHGQALQWLIVGSGNVFSLGGGLLLKTGIQGLPFTLLSRGTPLLGIVLLGIRLRRRYGDVLHDDELFVAAFAMAMLLRLVFEGNFWPYYLSGTWMALVLIGAVNGSFRRGTWTWIVASLLWYNPVPWAFQSNGGRLPEAFSTNFIIDTPHVLLGLFVILFLWGAVRRTFRWEFLVFVVYDFYRYGVVGTSHTHHMWPQWGYQLVLVPAALWIAGETFRNRARQRRVEASELVSKAGLEPARPFEH